MGDFDIPPLISLEEHFLTSSIPEPASYSENFKHLPKVAQQLYDLDYIRLSEMDEGGVSLQVISHAPMLRGLSVGTARAANDQLSEAVARHSGRYAGFAALPMADPQAAADELRRAVQRLKFVGALVDNHSDGKHYDGPEYDVLWEELEALEVPIYLHPTWPSKDMAAQFAPADGSFSDGAAVSLGSSGFGWHADVHLHVLRLYAAGVFDRFPKLKVVIGHFGESLPYMLQRVSNLSVRWGPKERKFIDVYRENIWVTTSAVWSLDPLATILRNTPIDHILYSVDYPFTSNRDGLRWVLDLKDSGLVTDEQLEMICYKNAEKLLGVKAPR